SRDSSSRRSTVGAVIATPNRPQLMRRALDSVLAQDYPGAIRVVLVLDRSARDFTLVQTDPNREVVGVTHQRTAGMAGARDTGLMALDTEYVAFCVDDDEWLAGKLSRQIDRLQARPGAQFVTTAMLVDYEGKETTRTAGKKQVTIQDLTRSRMAML